MSNSVTDILDKRIALFEKHYTKRRVLLDKITTLDKSTIVSHKKIIASCPHDETTTKDGVEKCPYCLGERWLCFIPLDFSTKEY